MTEKRTKERRAKGTGSVRKIGKIYYLIAKINDQIVKKSLHTHNKVEAGKIAAELLPDLMLQTREDMVAKVATIKRLKKKDKVKLSEAWEMFFHSKLRRQNTSAGTLKNYERNYKRFYSWLQTKYPTVLTLSDITLEIAHEYARVLELENLAGATYNYHIRGMGTITKALMQESGITENVWLQMPPKNKNSIGKNTLNQDEINRLFAVFDDESFCPMHKEQLQILFYIGLKTGMRLADCALLKWRSINMATGIISLTPVKTKGSNKRVTLPIDEELRSWFNVASEKWGRRDHVLPSLAERYLRNICGVSDDTLKVFRRAGFETTISPEAGVIRKRRVCQYGFHSLRHTFCSECASRGVHINILAEMTGDSVRTLEQYYVEIQDSAIQRAVESLPTITSTTPSRTKAEVIAEFESLPDLTEREKSFLALWKQY